MNAPQFRRLGTDEFRYALYVSQKSRNSHEVREWAFKKNPLCS
ncbi:hypothetical protein LEP1GSC194_4266 [Leptospira alstonii serovar Sichuan str. 79601]|uniref:Uncharacterized protein n=1 Tax=Leptospira alstonii serovar Sichuan str. 79601 TaxID=1218565 RepID=M6DDT2_9LEPT|nr:hypothetical protein LEP1GSC194_4266 [Leptospira alstonii serovar Sichuan str. 79601]